MTTMAGLRTSSKSKTELVGPIRGPHGSGLLRIGELRASPVGGTGAFQKPAVQERTSPGAVFPRPGGLGGSAVKRVFARTSARDAGSRGSSRSPENDSDSDSSFCSFDFTDSETEEESDGEVTVDSSILTYELDRNPSLKEVLYRDWARMRVGTPPNLVVKQFVHCANFPDEECQASQPNLWSLPVIVRPQTPTSDEACIKLLPGHNDGRYALSCHRVQTEPLGPVRGQEEEECYSDFSIPRLPDFPVPRLPHFRKPRSHGQLGNRRREDRGVNAHRSETSSSDERGCHDNHPKFLRRSRKKCPRSQASSSEEDTILPPYFHSNPYHRTPTNALGRAEAAYSAKYQPNQYRESNQYLRESDKSSSRDQSSSSDDKSGTDDWKTMKESPLPSGSGSSRTDSDESMKESDLSDGTVISVTLPLVKLEDDFLNFYRSIYKYELENEIEMLLQKKMIEAADRLLSIPKRAGDDDTFSIEGDDEDLDCKIDLVKGSWETLRMVHEVGQEGMFNEAYGSYDEVIKSFMSSVSVYLGGEQVNNRVKGGVPDHLHSRYLTSEEALPSMRKGLPNMNADMMMGLRAGDTLGTSTRVANTSTCGNTANDNHNMSNIASAVNSNDKTNTNSLNHSSNNGNNSINTGNNGSGSNGDVSKGNGSQENSSFSNGGNDNNHGNGDSSQGNEPTSNGNGSNGVTSETTGNGTCSHDNGTSSNGHGHSSQSNGNHSNGTSSHSNGHGHSSQSNGDHSNGTSSHSNGHGHSSQSNGNHSNGTSSHRNGHGHSSQSNGNNSNENGSSSGNQGNAIASNDGAAASNALSSTLNGTSSGGTGGSADDGPGMTSCRMVVYGENQAYVPPCRHTIEDRLGEISDNALFGSDTDRSIEIDDDSKYQRDATAAAHNWDNSDLW